ncbi:MAG TPA: DegT/DnrJ/EryC1/StrS family aminotransferase [Pseudothermotoga sp.]|nr:DegT/DnrJ/EryC1/StrS family aminotransferase [Pseudothermotoga sp.]HOK82983.1 DegT/DnrJ/EryC1/StrS family aminotransferase [Pseudothermotoga sp.]HPP69848.1 DegT/DnrJ/EryC1/StrS family aminotransferase [Pseudothermotoga sp.]
MIQLSKPYITQMEIDTVVEVLKSDRLSMGRYTELFEKQISQLAQTKFSVAVNSGTAALHLILKALGIQQGDYMVVPSFTFVASANVALFEKAIPIFVDIDPRTYNVDATALEELLLRIEQGRVHINGQRVRIDKVKILMVVDVFGQPVDYDKIEPIANRWNLKVIEDSCEALGSEYKNKPCGSFGEAGAFAFYPNKQITTGEGGIIVTNNENVAKLCASMRNQGRGEDEAWLNHVRIGYNYRIDELSAALGYAQLTHLQEILYKRDEAAKRYSQLLSKYSWVTPPYIADYTTKVGWFVYVVKLDEKINRDRVIDYMSSHGVQVRNYFAPVHLQPFYKELFGYSNGMLPVTEKISKSTLAIPFYTTMTLQEQQTVVDILKEAVERVG